MSKTAIVLAGGGSRGAYQLGVWKALREMGVDYQLVTGTSVGALNGTLMVQQDYEKACQVWENITSEDIVGDMLAEKGDLNDHQLNRIFAREALEKGGADISYLEKFVYSLLDEEKFWNSEIDFALAREKDCGVLVEQQNAGILPLRVTHNDTKLNNILFDEKIAGSIHFTPGNCYEDAPNGNKSAIHWDLVLIMTPEYGGGEIWFDDVLIRKDGLFVLPELQDLNP